MCLESLQICFRQFVVACSQIVSVWKRGISEHIPLTSQEIASKLDVKLHLVVQISACRYSCVGRNGRILVSRSLRVGSNQQDVKHGV